MGTLTEAEFVLSDGKVLSRRLPKFPSRELADASLDLFTILNCLFLAEDVIRSSKSFVSTICIPLRGSYESQINTEIEDLISFLFHHSVNVKFQEDKQSYLLEPQLEFSKGYTCLFSGGIDSLSGILASKRKYGENVVGALTKHPDQQYPKALVRLLEQDQSILVHIREIVGPKHFSYNRLLRGMLYFSNALMLSNTNVIISEIGPTMFQPRFTLLDDVSLTTHPVVLSLAKKIAEQILGLKINLIKPNENLTKAEVAVSIGNLKYVRLSCSCRRTRFANYEKPNCGMCYACAIRRFGLAVAGVEDSSYMNEGMTSSKLESFDEVLQVLRFSLDFLEDRDAMPRYQIANIKRYEKEGVFERFSLDNVTGLWLVNQKSELSDPVFERILEMSQKVVSKDNMQERIASVRDQKFKPDFDSIL